MQQLLHPYIKQLATFLTIVSFFLAPLAPIFAQEAISNPEQSNTEEINNTSIDTNNTNEINTGTVEESNTINQEDNLSNASNEEIPISNEEESNGLNEEPQNPEPLTNPSGGFGNDTRDLPNINLPQIDKASGGLVYNFEIKTPPGRNGFNPKISLNYNSQENDNQNIFGYGWGVDIPYIKRLNKTGIDKLYIDNYFYSSLSGELVLVSGNTYAPKVEDGKFLTYNFDGTYWTIKNKEGMIYKFGENPSARQNNTDDTKTFKWMLEETRDTNDNYIKYEYYKDEGQIYPESIIYTGNGNVDGIFSISFLRESRNDNILQNYAVFNVKTNYRINEIQTKINGNWVSKYELDYVNGDNGKRSLLSSIIESGKDETLNIVVLPALEFSYQTITSGPDFVSDFSWSSSPSQTLFTDPSYGTIIADVNNDGLPDLLESWQNQDYWYRGTYLNNGDGTWTEDENLEPPFPFAGEAPIHEFGIRAADINGDGLTDIVQSYNNGPGQSNTIQRVYINTGTSWYLNNNWEPKCFFSGWPMGDPGCRLFDINGDNLPDFVQAIGDNSWNPPITTQVYLNNGNGWNSLDNTWNIPIDLRPGVMIVDYNGDGLVDFLKGYKNPSPNPPIDIKQAYKNNGDKTWSLDSAYAPPIAFAVQTNQSALPLSTGTELADINGDGLIDILKGTETESGVHLNSGTGWYFSTSWDFGYGSAPQYTPSPVRLGDFDGDGMIDKFNSASGSSTLSRNQKKRADLMIIAENQYGGVTDIEYKATPKYVNSNGDLLNPDLPFVMMTVYQTTSNPGQGNPNIINTYLYEGGDYYFNNNLDKRFSGFNKISENDSLNKTITYFHQGNQTDSTNGEYEDHPSKIGKAYRIESYNNSGNLYNAVVNKWDRYNQDTGRDFVKLNRKTNLTYDGDNDHKDTSEEYVFEDTYGNLTQRVFWGEVNANNDGTFTDTGNDKYTEEITYANNTNEYIVGLPAQDVVIDQNSNKVRESKTYYDGEILGNVDIGNITKVEKWKDGNNYVDTEKTYDGVYGLPITITDERGNVTNYSYDQYNLYPETITDALSYATNYLYDYSSGKVKQTITPDNLTFQTVYDGLDRVKEEKVPNLEFPFAPVVKTSYQYIDNAGAISIIQNNYLDDYNQVVIYQYFDGLNRLIQERKETEGWDEYATRDIVYNSINKIEKESLPYISNGTSKTSPTTINNLYKNYTYDANYRVVNITDSIGNTNHSYDDWKTTITDPNGNIKHYYRDAYSNLIRVDEINDTETYSTYYDWNGNQMLLKITDALGNVRNFTYDGLNRRLTAEDLHQVSDNTFGTWYYSYDDTSNLIQVIDPNDKTINYTYNDINQKLTEDDIDTTGVEITYSYNECLSGMYLLCGALMIDGSYLHYTYNSNKIVDAEFKEFDDVDMKISYHYDRQGNLIEIINPDKSEVKYNYDSAGQINYIQRKERGDWNYSYVILNIDYGPNGKISLIEYPNAIKTRYLYGNDNMYRLNKIVTTNSSNIYYGSPNTVYFYSNRYGDGNIQKYNTDWDIAHDSDTGSPNASSNISYVRTGKHSDNYYVTRGLLPFDTSTLPRDANIIDANLRVYVQNKKNIDNDGNDFITVVNTTQQNVNEINPEDFNEFGNTNNPIEGIDVSERKDITNISEYDYLTFNLNETGRSWIDKVYYTKLGLREGHDVLDDLPVSPDNETDFNEVEFRTANYSNETYDPVLEVTYTLPLPTVLQDLEYTYDANGNIIEILENSNTALSKDMTLIYDDLNRLNLVTVNNTPQGYLPYTQTFNYNAIGNILSGPAGTYVYSNNNYTNPHAPTTIFNLPANNRPVIDLTGEDFVQLVVGDTWAEPGYMATDFEDGNLTNSVNVLGDVDTNEAGVYQLVYSVLDSNNQPATNKIRTVFVRDVYTPSYMSVKTLVVAGGGSGGQASYYGSGGGGAGGLLYELDYEVFDQSYPIVVGSGGINWTNGQNSSFDNLVAIGGGRGGSLSAGSKNGASGGSGGGGSGDGVGGSGIGGQGYSGGGSWLNSGGGGGASSSGYDGGVNPPASNGGNGFTTDITGYSVCYAGGGGGLRNGEGTGLGVCGGGNGSYYGNDATPNTGGGGGGSGASGSRNGGSGIVVISYKTDESNGVSPQSTGGIKTTVGEYTIHKFLSTDTFTVVPATNPPPNERPEINLNGNDFIELEINDTWTDPGYTAFDEEDGDITSLVVADGVVDTSTLGIYTIVYSVEDSQNVPASSKIRTIWVKDTFSNPNIELSYDNNGNLIEKGEDQYVWNYKNQLIESIVNEEEISYTYDHNGNRLKTQKGNDKTFFLTKYYEIDPSGKIINNIYAGNQLLATIEKEGGLVVPYYIHTDHLNSTNLITNDNTEIVNLIDYYPFGETRIKEGNFDSKREYIGQVYDEDTGLNYLNARYYNNVSGQFISQDPVFLVMGDAKKTEEVTKMKLENVLMDPQSLNSYSYARNNPIVYSDPEGKFAQLLLGAGAGLVGQYGYDVYNNIQANGFSASAFVPSSSGGTYITRAIQGALVAGAGIGASAITSNTIGQAATVGIASGLTGAGGNYILGQTTTSQSVVTDAVIGGLTFGVVKSAPLVSGRLPNLGTGAFFAGKHTQQSAMQLGVDAVASYISSLVGSFSLNRSYVKPNTTVNNQSSHSTSGQLLKIKNTQ